MRANHFSQRLSVGAEANQRAALHFTTLIGWRKEPISAWH